MFHVLSGRSLSGRSDLLSGEGVGEAGGAAGSGSSDQRGVSEGDPEGGGAVVR